jgi:hypothetical protein
MKVSIGDKVRVHYHPPGERKSFAEGMVRRVAVTTTAGRGFLIDITHHVVLGREQPVKSGYQHYVLYERPDDFPDRVEMLSQVPQEPEPEPAREADPAHQLEAELSAEAEVDREPAPAPEPQPVENQDSRGLGNVIGALFRRRA